MIQILNFLESYDNQNILAFSLAFIASMGTFVGGLLIVLVTLFTNPTSQSTHILMGILQGFSAGVMLYITCFDLIPEAIEQLGSNETMVWFFIGITIFGFLEIYFIPEDHDHSDTLAENKTAKEPIRDDDPTQTKMKTRSSTKKKSTKTSDQKLDHNRERMIRTSYITFLAMALHNLPEGLGVYLSALSNTRLGLELAIGIMLHNIPEGMAVAIPLYGATKSHSKVLFYTFLNGLAEPIGVLIGGSLLHAYINPQVLSRCLALVGGIMVCISIHELQPMAIKYSGKVRASISFFAGMLVCFGALEAVASLFNGNHSNNGHHHHH